MSNSEEIKDVALAVVNCINQLQKLVGKVCGYSAGSFNYTYPMLPSYCTI